MTAMAPRGTPALLLGLVALLAAACTPDRSERADRQRIDALVQRYAEASNAADPDALAALYAEQAILLPPDDGMLVGRDSIRAFWTDGLEPGIALAPERTEVRRGLAWVAGRYTIAGFEGAAPDSGKFVLCLQRDDAGDWAIAVDIWNTTPAPDELAPDAERDPRGRVVALLTDGARRPPAVVRPIAPRRGAQATRPTTGSSRRRSDS